MLPEKQIFHRTAQVFLLLTVAAFLAGCGTDHLPLAPTDGTALAADQDGLTFSTETAGVAKRGGKKSLTDSGTLTSYGAALSSEPTPVSAKTMDSRLISEVFGSRGGHIAVQDERLSIVFDVPREALQTPTLIEMEVSGSSMSGLEVRFGPPGLDFELPCALDIKLYGDAIDVPLSELEAVHIGGDGTEDQAGIVKLTYDPNGNTLHLQVEVPGFSRYLIRRSR